MEGNYISALLAGRYSLEYFAFHISFPSFNVRAVFRGFICFTFGDALKLDHPVFLKIGWCFMYLSYLPAEEDRELFVTDFFYHFLQTGGNKETELVWSQVYLSDSLQVLEIHNKPLLIWCHIG